MQVIERMIAMAKILLTPYWLEIKAHADESAFVNLISHVSNIHATRVRNTYRCSLRLLPDVLYYMRGVQTVSDLPDGPARHALEKELKRVSMTVELKRNGSTVEYPGLWGHQNLGVALAEVNPRYNFFYDTRTGKTRMAFQIMYNALKAGKVKRCIVFAPSTIIKSWLSDAEAFPELKVVAFYGNSKDKLKALQQPSHVVIWSEGMAVNYLDLIKKIGFDMCFFDESSKMKNYRSQISKAMLDYSLTVPYWYNLSATPAPNGKEEYYVQMRTVDPYAFNPARTHFVNKFFIDMSRSPKYQDLRINPAMDKEFMDIIESRSIYVDQSVMPTAGKEWHTVPFSLTVALWPCYEGMRKDMAVEANETEILADTAVAMRAKLCQITSGFVLDTEAIKYNSIQRKLGETKFMQEAQKLISTKENPRLHALHSLLCKLGVDKQFIIWAHYEQEFEDISTLLTSMNITHSILRGGSSIEDKEAAIASFKHHKTKILICHPLSVGMGINLTEAYNAIYYRVTDSWEALKQSSERIAGHIAVQPNRCHYWILLAEGPSGQDTIDRLVYRNVTSKRDASTGFLHYLKAGVLGD